MSIVGAEAVRRRGTGRPNDSWPCSLRKLADEAGRLRAAQVPDADETNR
jgi:hypothetical protein